MTPPPLVPSVLWTKGGESAPTLLHLDFHPFNILIDPSGSPVVIDWANAASGPAALDRARTAVILTFDPAARRLSSDPRWNALVQGWSDECNWDTIQEAAWTWALQFLLRDLTPRCSATSSSQPDQH